MNANTTKYVGYSIQKKRNKHKQKQKEETLQKEKHKIINLYYDTIEELQYKSPYQSSWNNAGFIIGIWNEKEKKIEFINDIIINLDKEIQKLFNPLE